MLNITFTHKSVSGNSAKLFKLAEGELVVDQKVPNQAREIIKHAIAMEQETFTYSQLCDFIDDVQPGFTTSKGGIMRIVRYYSKLLQEIGAFEAA